MRNRISKIEEIRAIISTPPEPGAAFWFYEKGQYFRFEVDSSSWKPDTLIRMRSKDMLFIHLNADIDLKVTGKLIEVNSRKTAEHIISLFTKSNY